MLLHGVIIHSAHYTQSPLYTVPSTVLGTEQGFSSPVPGVGAQVVRAHLQSVKHFHLRGSFHCHNPEKKIAILPVLQMRKERLREVLVTIL